MRARDRTVARGAGRRFQHVLAYTESQNRTRDRKEEESGTMDRAGGRNFRNSNRARDNDWDNLRVAPQRGRQAAPVVAAVHHYLLRVDGSARWNFRFYQRPRAGTDT